MVSIGEIWNELLDFGYEQGDDIVYYDFVQCCENVNVEPSEYIMDKLHESYNVNIG